MERTAVGNVRHNATASMKHLSSTGYNSGSDRKWSYHFREGGYDDMLYVDIQVETLSRRKRVRSTLRKVHVPGDETPGVFRVFGYLQGCQSADHI